MIQVILFLAFAQAVHGQTAISGSGPATARPGQTVNLAVTITTSSQLAGLQWTAQLPTAIGGPGIATLGAAAQAAEKQIYCSTDGSICLVVGMNDRVIASGEIARYSVTIPPAAPKGLYQVPLSDVLAADAAGVPIAVTLGPVYELRILARADIDGDGAVTMEDFRLMLDQVIGRATCTDDQTGDGKCDLLDVLAVVRASFDK